MTRKILELLVCLLHPVAVVLIWIELLQRDDIGSFRKLLWGVAVLIPLVPFAYVLLGNDFL
jgi:cobalamin biosynthesis protein CobD/CbiB